MSLTSGLVYNQNYLNNTLTNNVFFLRAGFNFKPELWNKKYGVLAFSMNANFTNKFPTGKDLKTVRELTVLTNVTYGF
jgi:hypothetical protein